MADIARLAGVSASTVSRSLAGSADISEATRERVEHAARSAGYRINRHARSLRLQRSGLILVLIPDFANQNYADLLLGIDRAAFEHGYGILIGHTGVDAARSDRLADELFTGGVDGVLLTSGYCPPRLLERLEAGERLPVMRTLTPGDGRGGVPGVRIDEEQAAFEVVRHLVETGGRRIAHLMGPEQEVVSRQRRAGWLRAMAEAGLPAAGLALPGGFHLGDGQAVARRLLEAGPLPDAVFCSSDEAAFGLMAELRRAGVRVPADMAVAGFDDLGFSQVFDPPLTTVRLPRREMAQAAVRRLVEAINGLHPADDEVVPHRLIVRESSMGAASRG